MYKIIDNVLLAEPVTACYSVVKMVIQRVIVTGHTGCTAFGCNCMTAHRVNLGDEGYLEFWIKFGSCNGSAKTGTAGSDYGDISLYYVHFFLLMKD
jgi:hypothetical protein